MPFRLDVYHHFPQQQPNPDSPELLARLEQLTTSVAGLVTNLATLGARLMERIDQVIENLNDMRGLVDQLLAVIQQGDAEKQALRAQVAQLVADAGLAEEARQALAEKIEQAFAASEDTENKMREAIPGAPPVGGTPLLQSYATRDEFEAAVSSYTGPEAVTLNGVNMRAGTEPALAYFDHPESDGRIDTTDPSA